MFAGMCAQVLSGKVKPGQSSDPASGFATVEREPVALTPVLGGGQTPLTGNRKVLPHSSVQCNMG